MSDVNLSEFKTLYLSTAKEYIQAIHNGLEKLRTDPSNTDEIEIVHRSAHSLKSQSLVMGYETTGKLAHAIEVIFRDLHETHGSLLENKRESVEKGLNGLESSINQIETTGEEQDLTDLISLLGKESEGEVL